jgi:hypothetical protein
MITVALLAAAWISDGKPVLQGAAAYGDDPAPVMRRAFEVAAPGEAELAIASLGYYVVEVNGTRLSATSRLRRGPFRRIRLCRRRRR